MPAIEITMTQDQVAEADQNQADIGFKNHATSYRCVPPRHHY
jgi:hypothetical protein